MIGSIGSIGRSAGSPSLERADRRASGRYVEPAEGAMANGEQKTQFALLDLRAEHRTETLHHPAGTSAGAAASAPFVAQLAALGLGDAATGERRTRRDPSLVVARADALYRDGYRRVTDIEPGFFGAAEY